MASKNQRVLHGMHSEVSLVNTLSRLHERHLEIPSKHCNYRNILANFQILWRNGNLLIGQTLGPIIGFTVARQKEYAWSSLLTEVIYQEVVIISN